MSKSYDPFVDVKISGFEKQEQDYQKRVAEINNSTKLSEEESLGILQKTFESHRKAKISYIESATHMPFSTLSQYLALASDNDTMLSFRDSGQASLERLKEGATGKGFSEKAKSSQYGQSLAGYIPIQQEFSKAGDKGQAAEYNKMVNHRLNESSGAIANIDIALRVMNLEGATTPPKELNHLFETSEIVTSKPLLNKSGKQIFGFLGEDKIPLCSTSSKEPIFAIKNGENSYINEKTGEAFIPPELVKPIAIDTLAYITGVEKTGEEWVAKVQPITGDHDQLFIGTKSTRGDVVLDDHLTNKFGEQDDISIAVSTALIHDTKTTGAVKHAADSGAGSHKDSLREDDYDRLTTKFSSEEPLKDIISDPNIKELRSKKIGGNPYPEDFETPTKQQNYSFIIPKIGDVPEIVIVHKQEEMTPILNHMESLGYHVPINPRYGWERKEDGSLSLRDDRISAQTYKNDLENLSKKMSPEKFKNAKQDSQLMYALHEIIGLTRLQEPSLKKDRVLTILENRMNMEKRKFEQNYKHIAPLESSRITSILKNRKEISQNLTKIAANLRTSLSSKRKVFIQGESFKTKHISRNSSHTM